MSNRTVTCPLCGLDASFDTDASGVSTSNIDAAAYAKMCKLAPERPASDYTCPELSREIERVRRLPADSPTEELRLPGRDG
jgi:hypothetical protein